MEQEDVIRRLKGLSRTDTPPAPDFGQATLPTPVASRSGIRFGMGPLAAVVGVLALGTAALAIPEGAPLHQVMAGISTEITTDVAEAEADLDADDSGASGSVGANPCEEPPAAPTSTTLPDTPGGVEGGASVEVDPEDREAQIRAWREWREANCGPSDDVTGDPDDGSDDDSDAGGRQNGDRGKGANSGERGQSGERRPDGHPHEDDPCKGPPPHSNKPGTGDPERDDAQRKAEQEAWKQWHRENCPPGQTGEHPGNGSGQGGRPEDAGKPDDAGSEGRGGRPDGAGKPEGRS